MLSFALIHCAVAARGMLAKSIPFLLEADTALMVHVVPGSPKTLRCFADICAFAAQKLGVTEISLLDHDASQRVEARFQLSVNHFTPLSLRRMDRRCRSGISCRPNR